MGSHNLFQNISKILSRTGIFLIFSCFGVFFFEVYLWIKTLSWTSHRIITFVPGIEKWLSYQGDWHGLKKILLWSLQSPLTLFLLVAGILIFFISTKIDEHNL